MRSGNVCTGTHTLVCTGVEGAGPSYLLSSFRPEEAAPHLFSPQARTTFCPQTTFSEGRCGDKSSACGDGVVSRELACLWPTPSMGWLLSAGKMGRIPSRLVQLTSSPFLKRSQPAGKCHQGFPTPIPAQSGDPLGCRVLLSRRWSQACPPPSGAAGQVSSSPTECPSSPLSIILIVLITSPCTDRITIRKCQSLVII